MALEENIEAVGTCRAAHTTREIVVVLNNTGLLLVAMNITTHLVACSNVCTHGEGDISDMVDADNAYRSIKS